MTTVLTRQLTPNTILARARQCEVITTENAVFIDGGKQLQVLKGPLAISAVPLLLHLIDGHRSVQHVINQAPSLSPDHILLALTQLREWGVVNVLDDCAPSEIPSNAFFTRYLPGQADTAVKRIQDIPITVVHDANEEPLCRSIAAALRGNGHKSVAVLHSLALRDIKSDDDSLFISTSDDLLKYHLQAAASSEGGSPMRWLRTSLSRDTRSGSIGPYFTSDTPLCVDCLSILHSQRPKGEVNEIDYIWASLVASFITLNVSAASQERCSRQFRTYALSTMTSTQLMWPFAELCIFCDRRVMSAQASLPSLAEQYEAMVSLRPLLDSDLQLVRSSGVSPQGRKAFLHSSKIALPALDPTSSLGLLQALREGTEGRAELDILELATLLGLSVGLRSATGGTSSRWTPSAGNLGSCEAYILVTNVARLRSGLYYYVAEEHSLARIELVDKDIWREAISSVGANDALQGAFIIFNGAYRRLSQKYNEFAYKLLHLDAGVASAQLAISARARGVNATKVVSFDATRLQSALGLRPQEELITVITRVGGIVPSASLQSYGTDTRASSGAAFVAADTTAAVEHLILQRWLSIGKQTTPTRAGRAAIRWRLPSFRRQVNMTTEEVFRRRRSVYTFATRLLSLKQVQEVVYKAAGSTRDYTLDFLIVLRTSSFRPGAVYRYTATNDSFVGPIRELVQEQLDQLYLQPSLTEAPCAIFILGSEAGVRSNYEDMLIRSGAVGQRLWLTSLASGLCGALIAGITSYAGSRSFGGASRSYPLLAFLCGYPGANE